MWVESALEECAENGRINVFPVQFGGLEHGVEFGLVQFKAQFFVEQIAVKAPNEMLAEIVGQRQDARRLVGSYVDRRPPTEGTVQYEGDYDPALAVEAPTPKTQYGVAGINPEDL